MCKIVFGIAASVLFMACVVCFIGIFASDTLLEFVKHVIGTPLLFGAACGCLSVSVNA